MFVCIDYIFSRSKMILLTKLNRPQNDRMSKAWKEGGGRFKVSVDDEAPLPRGIACATRSIRALLNAGLMVDSSPPLPSLLDVWQPSTVSFTILYHGPCYQFIPVHSKSNYCLGTCFVFLRMETPLFRIVRFGALWFQGNDHLPSLLASSRSKPKPPLVSPRRHITWSLFQLLFSGTHKLRLNTFHPTFETSWYLPHSHPPFLNSLAGKLEKQTCPF